MNSKTNRFDRSTLGRALLVLVYNMHWKIELRYFYGWDDACWTEEINGETTPLRFGSVDQAQAALDEFFADVKAAVVAGGMDSQEKANDYRIVEINS